MSESLNPTAEIMAAVPPKLRARIVAGMRWTLWLSVLAAPFSIATNILLARVGAEVVGTYGLITVYLGLVTAFLYLGGEPVAIKFIPGILPRDRPSFFFSYLLLICASLLPWIGVAALWPGLLHYFLGTRSGAPFEVLVLCLSPIYILCSLASASLKGILEIRWAQTVTRVVTVGSFLCYATIYIGFRNFLASHYAHAVWIIYLSLLVLATVMGLRRLIGAEQFMFFRTPFRFYLPQGFWKYVFATQQLGIVTFAKQRLDYILLLNLGGLLSLGKYVAVSSLALMIPTVNTFFMDTLLPSLTNLLAVKDLAGASSAFSAHFRILLLVNAATTCGLMLFAGLVTKMLGANYASLESLIILMALFMGLSGPGAVGGALLYSVGKQQRTVWIALLQLVLFVALFAWLWPRWQLLGTVLAYGTSYLTACTLAMIVGKMSVPMQLSVGWDSFKQAVLLMIVAAVAFGFRPLPWSLALVGWVGALMAFLLAGRYSRAECSSILRCFMPTF